MSQGLRFLGFLACVYFLQKGGALTLLELALLPVFQTNLKVSSVTYQRMKTVVFSPFSLKPLLAITSDARPICGYQKRFYIVFTAIVGSVALFWLALSIDRVSASAVAAMSFACVLAVSVSDILTEGKYSEIIRKDKSGTASKLVTYVWVCIFLGRLIASIVAGPVSDHGGTDKLLFACAALTLIVCIPACLSWMPEKKIHGWQEIPEQLVYFGIILIVSTAMVVFSSVSSGLWIRCLVGTVCIASVFVSSHSLLKPDNPVAHYTNCYLFVASVTQVDISPLEYFYTSTTCDGPQLSYTWYITTCGVVSSIASAVGAVAVNKFAHDWSYRTLFVLSTVFKCAGGLIDLAVVSGWVEPSRVKTVFVLGDCTAKPIVAMLAHIPAVMLTSKLVIPGKEATMYSLLAGMQNLGALLSIVLGQVVAALLSISISETTCDIHKLPLFVVVAQIALPLISLCFIPYVPHGTLNGKLE